MAQENEAVTAEQYARESIRIARLTRELLKKFAAAHRDFRQMDQKLRGYFVTLADPKSFDFSQVEINPIPALFTDDDVHSDIEISKDLFLLVIQDRQVQELMDELDLPPERATLFEVIDADGSGTLQITELVQGLLKIRGDISKSDTVAALLATKAVQRIVEEMKGETRTDLQSLRLDFSSQIEDSSSSCPEFGPGMSCMRRLIVPASVTSTTHAQTPRQRSRRRARYRPSLCHCCRCPSRCGPSWTSRRHPSKEAMRIPIMGPSCYNSQRCPEVKEQELL
eukprot:s762_g5.t1